MKLNMKKIAIISLITYVIYVMVVTGMAAAGKQAGIFLQAVGFTSGAGCVLGIIYFGWSLYMYPARTAKAHNHPHADGLWWINLIFGWTLIPWLICLVIATNGNQAATPKTPPAMPPTATLEGALTELEALKNKNLITEEEYAAKRAKLLS